MRFWDTSAIIALWVDEDGSEQARRWVKDDGEITIWTLTPVEISSALWRRVREKSVGEDQARELERRSDRLAAQASVVMDVDAVKLQAKRLLRVHPIRAADSLQLAAAMLWAEGDPRDRLLHTFDGSLASAAQREGFTVPVAG